MATHKNPADENRGLSVLAQGVLAYDRYTFDLEATYAIGADANESILILGYVPTDCVLVEHLSRLFVPQIDSDGVPTGDWEVGTLSDTDALISSTAAETTDTVFFGEDFTRQTTPIGSETEPVAIVMRMSSAIATLGTGVIVFEPCFRARNPIIDA